MVKSRILENKAKFTRLMNFICDEQIPIKKRIDEALSGQLSIDYIGKGFISKVLVVHDPHKYFLQNDLFESKLRPFGLVLPRGLTKGEKYELTRDVLKEIMSETSIADFATLDQCIWMIKSKEQ